MAETLEEDEVMRCFCGGSSFELAMDGETVMCTRCKKFFKLGRHLFSGCAETTGMLYPYEPGSEPGEEGDWWHSDRGSQDWRDSKSSTDGRGSNFS